MKKTVKFIGMLCLLAAVSFSLATCEDKIIPINRTMIGITVSAQPDKVLYDLYEPFDPTGMVVSAIYDNGTMSPITGFEISEFSATTIGAQTVLITYGGFASNYVVFVVDSGKERASKPRAFIVVPGGTDIELECMSVTLTPYRVPAGTQYYVITDHVGTGDVEIWYCEQNNLGASRQGQRANRYGTNPPASAENAPRRSVNTNNSPGTTVRFVTTDWGYTTSPYYFDSEALVLQFETY